jgi:hypothetical protein
LPEAAPVRISGDVERLINRTERGWIVTLINNRGVYKPQQGLAQVDRSESIDVSLSLRGKGIDSAREWTTDESLQVVRAAATTATVAAAGGGAEDSLRLSVPPGGVRVVEIQERR